MIFAGDLQSTTYVLGSGSSNLVFRDFEALPQEFQFITSLISGADGLRVAILNEENTDGFIDFDGIVLNSGLLEQVVLNNDIIVDSGNGIPFFDGSDFIDGAFQLVVSNPSGITDPTRLNFNDIDFLSGQSILTILEDSVFDNSLVEYVTSEIVNGFLDSVFVNVSGATVVDDIEEIQFEFQDIVATGVQTLANLFYQPLQSRATIQNAFATFLQSTARFLDSFDVSLESRANIAFRSFERLDSRARFTSRPRGRDNRTYIKPAALWELRNGAEEVDLLSGGYTQIIGIDKDGDDVLFTEFPTGVLWRMTPDLQVYDVISRVGALAGMGTYLPAGGVNTYLVTTPTNEGSVLRVSEGQVGFIADRLGYFPYWIRRKPNSRNIIWSDPQNFRFVELDPITGEQTTIIQGTPIETGFSTIGLPFQFDIVGNDIYWVDASLNNRVFRGNISNGNFVELVPANETLFRPVGIAVDPANDIIYIATPLTQDDVNGNGDGLGAIWQMNIDGSQLRIRYEEGLLAQPNSLLMDGERLLIVDTGQGFNYISDAISIPNGDGGLLGEIPQSGFRTPEEQFEAEERIATIEQLEELVTIIPGYRWTSDPDNLFGVLEFNFGDTVLPGGGGGPLGSIEDLFAEIEEFQRYLQGLRGELQPLLDEASAALAALGLAPRDIPDSIEIEEDPIDDDLNETLNLQFIDIEVVDINVFIEAGKQARASGLLGSLISAALAGLDNLDYGFNPNNGQIYERDSIRRRIIIERPLFFARRRRRKERPHRLIDIGIIDRTGRGVYAYQAPPFFYGIVKYASVCCWRGFPYYLEYQFSKKAGNFYSPPPQNATNAEVREIFGSDQDTGTLAERITNKTLVALNETQVINDLIVLKPLERLYLSMFGAWGSADIMIQEIPTTYSDATIQYALDNDIFDLEQLDAFEENLL